MSEMFWKAASNAILLAAAQFSTPNPGWEIWFYWLWVFALVFTIGFALLFVLASICRLLDPEGYQRTFGGRQ